MSYQIMTEDQEPTQIGTSQGWPDFCEWVDELDEEDYPELVAFCDEGDTYSAADVMVDLRQAVKDNPPDDDVLDTAKGLMRFLKVNRKAEMIMVVSGVTAE
jgi:hypothetical protein